jgi:hypothetical protein
LEKATKEYLSVLASILGGTDRHSNPDDSDSDDSDLELDSDDDDKDNDSDSDQPKDGDAQKSAANADPHSQILNLYITFFLAASVIYLGFA